MFFIVLSIAQALLGIAFIASSDNTGRGSQIRLSTRAVAGTDRNFMIFIVSCSIKGPGYQARSILHLLLRFKPSAGIILCVAVTSLRFLRFRCHRGFGFQDPTAFERKEVQAHGNHRETRPGRGDLLCDYIHFPPDFDDVRLSREGMCVQRSFRNM